MTAAPRVAVILAVWNDERYLAQAVESVIAQTCRDWELVIIDDASTDASREIAESFADRHPDRISVLRLERNAGSAEARNRGIAASRGGDLLALLDSDDYWREDYLERQLALYDDACAAGRRVGIVACNAWLHPPEGVTGQTWADIRRWRDSIDLDQLLEYNYIFARTLFSRTASDEVGGFSPECVVRDGSPNRYAASDDYDLWLRIMEAGYEVAVTREPLAFYRLDPNGRSRNTGLIAEAAIVLYRRALARGSLTARQRRVARKRLRHWHAVRERERVTDALAERRRLAASALALRAAPSGLIAFLQSPGRWGEWTSEALHHAVPNRSGRNAS
jgi:teichuronic acid biosynthesis glycosyltransferase TuaG